MIAFFIKTNTMKKYIVLITLAMSVLSCSSSDVVKGNGNVVSKTVTTLVYDDIEVLGDYDVVLVDGEEGNVVLKGEQNLLEFIELKVDGTKLSVYVTEGKELKTSFGKDLIVQIPFKTLNKLELKGSGEIKAESPIFTSIFQVILSGSGEISARINAATTTVLLSGSGTISLEGQTKELTVDLTGSGDVEAFDLESLKSNVSIVGSGDIETKALDYLSVQLKGSGDVRYKGKPKQKEINVTGSGEVLEK